jgi:hypothetical protein
LDRANARQPLKDGDVAAGLRELAAAVQELAERGGNLSAGQAALSERVTALEAPKEEPEPEAPPKRGRS